MKKFLFILAAFTFVQSLWAQSVMLEPKQDAKKPVWGYVNTSTGKWVVKPTYNVAEPFKTGNDGKFRALVTKGNLQGFIGPDGKPLGAGIVFESIQPVMRGDNLIVSVKGKKGIVTPDGIYVQKPEFTDIVPLGDEGYIITSKGKKGIISADGATVVAPQYTSIDTSEDEVFIIRKGDKEGLTTRSGIMLLEPSKFNTVKKFGEYWEITKGNKKGLFDAVSRNVLIEPKYGDVREPVSFPGGMIFPVKKTNGKWGAVNASGNEVIKCKNQALTVVPALGAIRVFRNNVGERLYMPQDKLFLELESWKEEAKGPFRLVSATVETPSYDTPERMILGLSFGEHMGYSNNYEQRKSAYNKLPSKNFSVMVDKDGQLLGSGQTKYKNLGNNWVVMRFPGDWILYDAKGNKIREIPLRGENYASSPTQGWITDFNRVIFPDLSMNRFKYCSADLQFINSDGKWIPMIDDIPQTSSDSYSDVQILDKKSVSVQKNGKWGLFAGNRLVVPCQYDSFTVSPRDGLIEVRQNGYVGLYKPAASKWVIPLSLNVKQYEFYRNASDSPILIYNGKWGLADASGNVSMNMAYDKSAVLNSLNPKPQPASKPKPKQNKPADSTPKKKSETQFQQSTEKRLK